MQLPLLPLLTIDARPDLQGTQELKQLTPEETAARVAKRIRDIDMVMDSELYQHYLTNRGNVRIPVPPIRPATVGCRKWLSVMREWKTMLHEFRNEHGGKAARKT